MSAAKASAQQKVASDEAREVSPLEALRHSASHLLAAAVKELRPKAKPTIGPATNEGFYYDFEFEEPLSEEELPKIEEKMRQLVSEWEEFTREEASVDEALAEYPDNPYKRELIKELAKEAEQISFYQAGQFKDLCRGGHVENPKESLSHFKLLSIAGAYWRGDEHNQMLTRIYGTAFFSEEELKEHLENLKLAERYNHRRIGQEMELFAIIPEVGQGLPIWLPKGYAMRRAIEDYMIKLERSYGYEHALTPHINRSELFKISGHLDFYRDSMYPPMEFDDEEYYLKPMNCPAGMMIYKLKQHSYRDLPYKLGELGTVYRYEKSGELHGLQRVRGMTQNDAHIFCTAEQLKAQFREVMEMLEVFYQDIGFDQYSFRLSLSDPNDEKYAFCGEREDWEKMEQIMREILDEAGVEYEELMGDAAFYGPKLDVQATNVFGKEDSISTIQVDFNLPERFDLEYIDENNERQRPYVIHRALVGSFERFFAFLIEHHAGKFPAWYAPVQVKILPITDRNIAYAAKIKEELITADFRVEVDDRSRTLSAKIRQAQQENLPYMLVVGDREEESDQVAVRARDGAKQEIMSLAEFKEKLEKEVTEKVI